MVVSRSGATTFTAGGRRVRQGYAIRWATGYVIAAHTVDGAGARSGASAGTPLAYPSDGTSEG